MRFAKVVLPLLLLVCAGCGYRLDTKRANAGAGKTLAVPTFANSTQTYRIEQRLSESVRQELVRRTRYKVLSAPTGDVVVNGEVVGYTAIPYTIVGGRASSYLVVVSIRVVVTDTQSGKVLLRNDSWTFRENFELAPDSTAFVPEEPAAVERIGSSFASSLVAALLNDTP